MITEDQHLILCDYCKIRLAKGILNWTGDPCCQKCYEDFVWENKALSAKLIGRPFQT